MKDLEKVEFNSRELKISRTPITNAEIIAMRTKRGGYTRKTLAALGVPYPPPSGWLAALLKYGYPLFKFEHVSHVFLNAPVVSEKMNKKRKLKAAKEQRAKERLEQRNAVVEMYKAKGKNARPQGEYGPSKAQKDEFYASWEWRTLRVEVLKEHGRRCACCGATPNDKDMAGKPVRIVVDHIKPLSKYWHLRLQRSNLQPACDECNQGMGAWDETDYRKKPTPDEWLIEDDIPEALREQLKIRH